LIKKLFVFHRIWFDEYSLSVLEFWNEKVGWTTLENATIYECDLSEENPNTMIEDGIWLQLPGNLIQYEKLENPIYEYTEEDLAKFPDIAKRIQEKKNAKENK
jgi:hypothetical protein